MSHSETSYQADYGSPDVWYPWIENNISSPINEFCSSDNIDECLKYISQEFCALGYPSIYSTSISCPFSINCDIVIFLNATYELLKRTHRLGEAKEDLENRNRQLVTEINRLNKKNDQLQNTLEQSERKLAGALERERQLKEKNKHLTESLKLEKDEVKKLCSQLKQQKVVFQHEIKKYENNMNLLKTKLNRLISVKNPTKKIANMTLSNNLPRVGTQRAKWKTDRGATTAVEEMYNNLLDNYENSLKHLNGELREYREYLQFMLIQLINVVSNLQEKFDIKENIPAAGPFDFDCAEDLKAQMNQLFFILKNTVLKILRESSSHLGTDINTITEKLSEICKEKEEFSQNSSSMKSDSILNAAKQKLQLQAQALQEEKKEILKALEILEKEKANVANQKLSMLKLAVQQKVPNSQWHDSLNTVAAISLITSKSGITSVPTSHQLKLCLSAPESIGRSLPPIWDSSVFSSPHNEKLKSESALLKSKDHTTPTSSNSVSLASEISFNSSTLPSWALRSPDDKQIIIDNSSDTSVNMDDNELNLSSNPSSEEVCLSCLKTAAEDIEIKRTSSSPN